MAQRFDVIVIGGGHAGTEAAVAAARRGACVALLSTSLETIGQLSCNPAIGGIAKGTVVRELDALGGVMGRAIDRATIQFRMLNRSMGPAVWAPRAQADRDLYRRAVRRLVEAHPNVATIQGTAERLVLGANGAVAGVALADGPQLGARAVVITTGTFLRGRIHVGIGSVTSGGRAGEAATIALAEQFTDPGITTGRFKTGTPPRVDGRTVDLSRLESQPSEIEAFDYSWSHFWDRPRRTGATTRHPEQRECWITFVEDAAKQVVRQRLAESAMYGGAIGSRGPRYCPSIEDKIVRFPDAPRHQLFLEPEGLETSELYVNGLSTSLPVDAQRALIRAIPGLERAEMTRPGYAIKYDYVPPTQLRPTLATRVCAGLFLAGQINGSTGYEEAAGQGIVAGLNAAAHARELSPVTFGRESSYIGVLVDDLVTRGVDEPYRLFTSRSEFRLTVRQDNALRRLHQIGSALELYTPDERQRLERRLQDEEAAGALARTTLVEPGVAATVLTAAGERALSRALPIAEVAKRQKVSLGDLFSAGGWGQHLGREAVLSADLEIKYAGCLVRERHAAERLQRLGGLSLPDDAPYDGMRTVSVEARQQLASRRPATLAQAAGIPGVTPADRQNLVLELERWHRA